MQVTDASQLILSLPSTKTAFFKTGWRICCEVLGQDN